VHRLLRIPRDGWETKVEKLGLTFHHSYEASGEHRAYWDESVYYMFSSREIDELEAATNELHQMCLAAAEHVIEKDRFAELAIPPEAIPAIRSAWEREPPAIYGRFDLRYDGTSPPKMLEYNADTPTALLEAAVIQWYWHAELNDWRDQFNSNHEKLLDKWVELKDHLRSNTVHFCHADNRDTEDLMTAMYMRDVAMQAGFETDSLLMDQIGWDHEHACFVGLNDEPMHTVFKLYPWEWMLSEKFGAYMLQTHEQMDWIEPIWKMLLSNKGILPILWELYPDHPNLLPAYFDGPHDMAEFVVKPLLGREGANIRIVTRSREWETTGDYGDEGFVYQQFAGLPNFDGAFPLIGSWVIDQESAGIGIRESSSLITDNVSRFVPHVFEKV
jgi:glutathionylspermidine synthase